MSNIILTAENFAFGPISKLLFIASILRKKKHHLTFIGYGTSLQLAKKFPFDKIYEVDTDAITSKNILSKYISGADILISSMDLPSVIVAENLKVPTVWIDVLFWFWDKVPEITFNVNAYIREQTINDNKNEMIYKEKIKNFYTVGPIIGLQKPSIKKKQVLISYGGGEATHWYKVGKDTNYPFVMTSILERYVNWSMFDKVIIASNEKLIQQLKVKFPHSKFTFSFLPQQDFLKELSKSEILLTTAGLTTSESAFQMQIPIIFLPSSNNSHYVLLEEFRKLNLARASVQLSDFMKPLKLQDLSPHESMKIVMRQLKKLELSEDIQKKVGEKINLLIINRDEWIHKHITSGKSYLNSLGGNGTKKVVDIIESILKETT